MLDDFKQVSPIHFELNLNKLSINAFLFWIFLHSAFVCACVAITHGNVVLCLIFFSLKLFAWKKNFSKNSNGHFCADLFGLKCLFLQNAKKVYSKLGKKKRMSFAANKRTSVLESSAHWWMPSVCTLLLARVKYWIKSKKWMMHMWTGGLFELQFNFSTELSNCF